MAAPTLLPRPAVSPAPPPPAGEASAAAGANAAANLSCLSLTQPRLAEALPDFPSDLRPVFARDGSLTVLDARGKWWQGCSVPHRAAEAMLSSLDAKGRVACVLSPTTAGQLRVVLCRSRPDQAVIAICPDPAALRVILACDDFSADVRSHRLWFAWGPDWAVELKRLFAERSGLATPAQFIRLPVTPADEVDLLVAAAQATFGEASAERCTRVAVARDTWRRPAAAESRLCVVAPSHFRLWDDAGSALAEALAAETDRTPGARVVRFDPDDPACSSALALLEVARTCSAIVAADSSRADLPGIVPDALPWVTWVTRATSIPPATSAGPRDAIVLADPAWRRHAANAGWPEGRVAVGGWPADPKARPPKTRSPSTLAVAADTRVIRMPAELDEFSSHQLLWDQIAAELATEPFVVRDGAVSYLEQRMKRHGVSADRFDASVFIENLILPAYAQGVVRALVASNVPVRVFGHGWDQIAEFQPVSAGPITSTADLAVIRDAASAVVDVSAFPGAHPLHRLALPIVRADGASRRRFIDRALRALSKPLDGPAAAGAITLHTIAALLAR